MVKVSGLADSIVLAIALRNEEVEPVNVPFTSCRIELKRHGFLRLLLCFPWYNFFSTIAHIAVARIVFISSTGN
jgi:hypothetical protein